MAVKPEIRYVENDGVNLAYARWGEGTPLVYLPPWVGNVELMWELEEFARAYRRGGRYNDVLMMDKRGVGMSDRTNIAPTLDDRVSDTLAVLDAEGIESATMVGFSEAAATAIAMASRYPERTRSVILYGSAVPGVPPREVMAFAEEGDPQTHGMRAIAQVVDNWGSAESRSIQLFSPSAAGNPRIEAWQLRYERQSASPGALTAHLESAMSADISADIDRITCPTFIAHCRGDRVVPVATSRYLAHRLPHAQLRIWEGENHVLEFDANWADMQAEFIEFASGIRPEAASSSQFGVLLFTDIVGSTARAVDAGDEEWARRVAAHDATADLIIDGWQGRRIKSTGDGIFAMFGDPAQAVRAASRLVEQLDAIGIMVRAGIHAGQVQPQPDGDVLGLAVHIAARTEAEASPGRVAVTRTVADLLLGESLTFESIGERELKGVPQPMELFLVGPES